MIGLGLGLSFIRRSGVTAPAGTVLASLLVNSQTFYDAVVAAPIPNIAPGLLTNSQTFYDATVLSGQAPTPTLALTTPGATPVFGITAVGLLAGDIPHIYYASDAGFTTDTGDATAAPLSADEASGVDPDIDFGIGTPQTAGPWYYYVVIDRPGAASSAPSNVVNQTIASATGHLHWRFKFNSGSNTGLTLNEVQFLVGGVAQTDGTAFASQEYDATYTSDKAFDGLTGSGHQWASLFNNTWPIYLGKSYPTARDVDATSIDPDGGAYGPSQFDVEYADGATRPADSDPAWTNIYTSTGVIPWTSGPLTFTF